METLNNQSIIMCATNGAYKTYLVKKPNGKYAVLTKCIGCEQYNLFFMTFKTFEQAKKHFMILK